MDFTAADKLREIERELKMRRQVYPGNSGTMSKARERQLAIMEAIRDDYTKLVAAERLL